MSRHVEPNGERIARLREVRVWDQARLAKEAGVSLRTIQSLEAGKSCFRYTLGCVAKALGIDVAKLVRVPESPPLITIGGPSGTSLTVQFVINGTVVELDQTQLVFLIAEARRAIDAKGEIDVKDVRDGNSVVISCEIDLVDLQELLRLDPLQLRALGITEVRLPAGLRLQIPDRADRPRQYASEKNPPFGDPQYWYTA